MKKTVLKFRTIILSDVHLGAPDCQIDKVNHFLKHTHCERLILNGDIIDGWSLRRKGGWTRKHTRFIRLVLKKMEKKGTDVVYIRGNHDDVLANFLPLAFDNLRIVEDFIFHTATGQRYFCLHGDAYDAVTQNSKLLAILGDIGYQSLMKLNRYYNRYRKWRGKEFYSLSKAVKAHVKTAVSYISRFETSVVTLTKHKECAGFICGHIHSPADKIIDGVRYLNSGDWVESNTAIVEDFDGNLRVIDYDEFCAQLMAKVASREEIGDDHSPIEEDVDMDGLPVIQVPES